MLQKHKKKAPAIQLRITRAFYLLLFILLLFLASFGRTCCRECNHKPVTLANECQVISCGGCDLDALNESRLYLLLIAWAVIPSAAAASVRFNCSVANKLLIVGAIMFTPSFYAFLHYIIKSASKQLKNINFFRF